MPEPTWIRARQCSSSACVEVLDVGEFVVVRNSKRPEFGLDFTRAEWDAFVQGVRDGDFDNLGETG